jgi:microcystin-dependent protein
MSKHRPLLYGQPVPQSFFDAMQEFLGAMASRNLALTMVPGSANQIQIVAGVGSAQVSLGIDGLWRYISATTQTTVTGAAGTYDVFVTTGNNSFATNPSPPPPEIDSTDYTFALATPLPQGSTPSAPHYRKIAEVIFDGSRVLSLRQTVGADGAQLAQPGDLKMSAAASPPAGWLICQGQAVSRTTYAALYAALGAAGSPWGQGDGSTTFNVPDLRGRAPIGAGQGVGLANRALGSLTGAETTTLTWDQSGTNGNGSTGNDTPDHAHSGTTDTENQNHAHSGTTAGDYPDHSHATAINNLSTGSHALAFGSQWTGPGVGYAVWGSGGASARHQHDFGTSTENAAHNHNFGTGGANTRHQHPLTARNADTPHTNMQPSTAVSYFVKT